MKRFYLAALLSVMATSSLAHGGNLTPDQVDRTVAACGQGSADACQSVGEALVDREKAAAAGLPYNPANALQFLEAGCRLGDLGACSGVGRLLTNGGGRNADYGLLDIERGTAVLRDTCRRGSNSACGMLERMGQ